MRKELEGNVRDGTENLRSRLEELEANLIAQDHRAIPVLRTFFVERRNWSRSDPRWSAAWTSFLWWCVGGIASPAGAVVGLAAFLTLALTGWNVWEFRRQNETLAQQNLTLKRQVDQQELDNRIVRRAQLLATIYEEECVSFTALPQRPWIRRNEHVPPSGCRPRSHVRARREAVLAFLGIARSLDEEANLSFANLSGADFLHADLSGANLRGANLSHSNLNGANLNGTSLERGLLKGAIFETATLRSAAFAYSDLSEANLREADLTDAYFFGADLKGADLRGADLRGAELAAANLQGANLQGSLIQEIQLVQARGDRSTILPGGLVFPDSWTQ